MDYYNEFIITIITYYPFTLHICFEFFYIRYTQSQILGSATGGSLHGDRSTTFVVARLIRSGVSHAVLEQNHDKIPFSLHGALSPIVRDNRCEINRTVKNKLFL